MAKVFLSYDRADLTRARSVAQALEKAGHSVWWDRHIKGGAQYSKEIEDALRRADAVVVLWSLHSVESAWVRDEAAAGRDSGRLVPVKLDLADPPMGFRQYQSIELASGGRSARQRGMAELIRTIGPTATDTETTFEAPQRTGGRTSWIAGAIVVAGAAIAMLLWLLPARTPATSSFTVLASENSAPARGLAGDLLVKLGSFPASRGASWRLLEPAAASDADFSFKVGQVGGAGDPQANLALIDRGGSLLWSRQFIQPGGNQADLRQQVAYSAGQVLRCAIEALAPTHPKLKPAALKLYLTGCADLAATTDPATVVPIFLEVTQQAPQFAEGWGKLLIAELGAFRNTAATDAGLRADLRRHTEQARKVDPDLAEISLVQSWLQPPRPISGWMRYADEAAEKNPDNSEILQNLATGLSHFGLMRAAIDNARRATEIDPLSPAARQALIVLLADSGALAAANRELAHAERLWPGASSLIQMRFILEYRYGDPAKALRLIEDGSLGRIPAASQTSFLAARINPSPAAIEEAVNQAREAYRKEEAIHLYLLALLTFGRSEEAIDVLLSEDPRKHPGLITMFFRTSFAPVRKDPRFMRIAKAYGLVDYWRSSGRWPDFCSEPDLPYDCKQEAGKLTGQSPPTTQSSR